MSEEPRRRDAPETEPREVEAGEGDWTVEDLQAWDARIREKAVELGLDLFPQEFEICDQDDMLGYMAYSGLPAHYPHWSFGKRFEKMRTLHEVGVTGLPYEMVINSNPTLAYLMRDNTLCQQILTIAHVYGHNDFFKNNFYFRATRPELAVSSFKLRADRVRSYREDPSIGAERVERVLDAAHALWLQINRDPAMRKLGPGEQRDRALRRARGPDDPYERIHSRDEPEEQPDLDRVPLEPDADLLLFIRDHNPYLEEWERDLLTIVDDQARYFLPQIETKIMNEGWASFWHHRILNELDLPQGLHLEFLVHHNQVVRPQPGGVNPYHVGFVLWHRIAEVHGHHALFEAREADRDVSFLRRFLDEETARELDLFEFEKKGRDRVASRVSDPEEWEAVKSTFLQQVGTGSIPVIRVHDADHNRQGALLLRHEHDGRDLEVDYAARTLEHAHTLWRRRVLLDTQVNGEPMRLAYDADDGFDQEALPPG